MDLIIAKGVKGRAEYDGETLRIVESGLFGDKGAIELRAIRVLSVNFKDVGIAVGFIHFYVHGGKVNGGLRDDPIRDLTITFRKKGDEDFRRLYDAIVNRKPPDAASPPQTQAASLASPPTGALGQPVVPANPAYCSNCGNATPSGARFCPVCGQSTAPPGPVQAREVCTIRLAVDQPMIGATRYQFIAEAVGPNGAFTAAATESFKPGSYGHDLIRDQVAQMQLDGLISDLTADGWQPSGLHDDWYAHQFQRALEP